MGRPGARLDPYVLPFGRRPQRWKSSETFSLEAMRGIGAHIVLVLKFAPDKPVRMPERNQPIPGSRLRYADLRPDDGLFVNMELDKAHPAGNGMPFQGVQRPIGAFARTTSRRVTAVFR